MQKITTRHPGTNCGTSSALFAPSFVRQPSGLECTQIVQNHQNISLGSNGVDRVRSLRKILTRLRGTNFCTSSGHFASSLVRQTNGPERTQIVRNAPKRQFRVQWAGSGAFVMKNSDATSWHELCTSLARFAPNFVRQPNGPECTKIVRNALNRQFRVQCGDWMHSL